MLDSVLRRNGLQTIDRISKGFKEVIDYDLVVPRICHQIFLARRRDLLDLLQERSVPRIHNAVLEQLQQERSIETASVSPHPSHILIASIEHIKAVLELVRLVLFLEILEGQQVADMGHALVDLSPDLLLVRRVRMIPRDPLIDFLLGRLDLLLGHLSAARRAILLIICCVSVCGGLLLLLITAATTVRLLGLLVRRGCSVATLGLVNLCR